MRQILENLKLIKRWLVVLVARCIYGNPSKKLKIVGVTGTNGKTTTASLLYEVALALGHKAGLISTVNILISGKEITVGRKMPTTPNVLALNKIFSQMVKEGCEYVFMEVTSHAMDQKRVAGVHFVGGVFSNLTLDHLNYHKTMQNYFFAKKSFFDSLPADAFALSNTDDEYGAGMLLDTKAKQNTYGFLAKENFHGEITKIDFSGIELKINDKKISSPLIGKFNAYNVLAAYCACMLLGFPEKKVMESLAKIMPPAGRFEYFTSKDGVLAVVDFAHSPDSLEKVILTAKEILPKDKKVISVFGCGGDIDPNKRKLMGQLGASLSDVAIFTLDNPDFEDPDEIIRQMKSGLSESEMKKIKVFIDRDEAIIEGSKLAEKGDILLLLGKGHENYQTIKGVKEPWSDMKKLRKALG